MFSQDVIILPGMLGAGCTHVAELLSQKFEWRYVNSERIIRRIVSESGLSFREFQVEVHSGEIDLDKIIRNVLLDEIREGKVIVEGRIAFLILDLDVGVKFFLWSSKSDRARIVSKRRNIPLEKALEQIEESDEDRKSLVWRLYKKDWLDLDLYDMIINTSKWSYEGAAEIIIKAHSYRKR
ncbi:MAG: hypothetical protein DRJ64_06205 [Thermoprotei archaeon]|nr:MAG: hypothetical protein DRJ64_06205 [Thermoprotei archaeon]